MKLSKNEIIDSLISNNNTYIEINDIEKYADKVLSLADKEVLRDEKGKLLGYILYYNNRPDIFITMVWVNEQERGKGLAKKMLKSIINNNNKNILLEVHKDNPAKLLYQKLGFKKTSIINDNLQMKLTNN